MKTPKAQTLLSNHTPHLDQNKSFWPRGRNIPNWDVVKLGIVLGQLVLTILNYEMESDVLRKQGERVDTGRQ